VLEGRVDLVRGNNMKNGGRTWYARPLLVTCPIILFQPHRRCRRVLGVCQHVMSAFIVVGLRRCWGGLRQCFGVFSCNDVI